MIGLRENSNHKSGVVYVRTTGFKQDGSKVLEYVRWVMVRKRDDHSPSPPDNTPNLQSFVEPAALGEACPVHRQQGL